MKIITFATGNQEKVRDARFALSKYGLTVDSVPVEIDEIQHHDPRFIAINKAQRSFDILHKPLVVNDSSWSIPALGGFPGCYMKDITLWLTTEDFLALMKGKEDRRIFLHEVVVYTDGSTMKEFEALREGLITEGSVGDSPPSFARIVKMEGDPITISEIFDKRGERDTDPARYEHWNKFAKWYGGQD